MNEIENALNNILLIIKNIQYEKVQRFAKNHPAGDYTDCHYAEDSD
jgi:hypothetical protein